MFPALLGAVLCCALIDLVITTTQPQPPLPPLAESFFHSASMSVWSGDCTKLQTSKEEKKNSISCFMYTLPKKQKKKIKAERFSINLLFFSFLPRLILGTHSIYTQKPLTYI